MGLALSILEGFYRASRGTPGRAAYDTCTAALRQIVPFYTPPSKTCR